MKKLLREIGRVYHRILVKSLFGQQHAPAALLRQGRIDTQSDFPLRLVEGRRVHPGWRRREMRSVELQSKIVRDSLPLLIKSAAS
ncbi:MAG: hypothetical protein DMG22_13235 [Acidobacteria bacterium]|nr:MAG: hypothetical protein DMG22_13235 [Acidobacteriota bacterium]